MDIAKLFSTFHDFDIVGLDTRDDDLIITFRIPWGEMWDDFDFQIKVILKGGEIVLCKYFEWTDDKKYSGEPPSIDKETTDIKIIEQLGLDVQRYESLGANSYWFWCNGSDKVGGGEITLKADNFELIDVAGRPLSTEKYESWFNDWWTLIQGG